MPRATLDKHPHDIASMFDGIAPRYDLVNDLASLGQVRLWRRATVQALNPQPGERILDLAAGTGTSSDAILTAMNHSGIVVPCDLSQGMIDEGLRRYPHLPFTLGNATELPFTDGEFDAVTISFGLRNVNNTAAALAEMLRVVRPGGRMVICEFSTPTNPSFASIYHDYLMRYLPKLAGAVTRDRGSYEYLGESIRSWPDQLGLAAHMRDAGWGKIGYRNLSGGIVALHRATKQ